MKEKKGKGGEGSRIALLPKYDDGEKEKIPALRQGSNNKGDKTQP